MILSIYCIKNVANVIMNTIDLNSIPQKSTLDVGRKDNSDSAKLKSDVIATDKKQDLKELINVGEYTIDMDKLGAVLLKNI